MSSDLDVAIIGSGPAGEKAAMQAAKLRQRVAVIERAGRLGGNCLHTATIPSKTLRETILYVAGVKQRSLYGIQTTFRKDLTVDDLMRRKEAVIDGQLEVLEHKLDRNAVTIPRSRSTTSASTTATRSSGSTACRGRSPSSGRA